MSKVINLADYRRKSRKAYLIKHGARLDLFVERFVRTHIDVDFRQLAADYQAGEEAWDYVHFREILAEALDEVFGKILYASLRGQSWFNDRHITQEELIDRCLSSYVLSGCDYASLPR